MEQPVRLRLSVWRPAKLDRSVDYSPPMIEQPEAIDPNQNGGRHPFSTQHLYEEIYRWSSDVDFLSGISNPEQSARIAESLVTSFDSTLSPHQRDMATFGALVTELEGICRAEDQSAWLDCPHIEVGEKGEPVIIRMAPVLALFHHLSWVHETFRHIPGASVTFR